MSGYGGKQRNSFREPVEDGIRSIEALIKMHVRKAKKAELSNNILSFQQHCDIIEKLNQRLKQKTQEKPASSFLYLNYFS